MMRHTIGLMLLITATLAGFTGYCYVLIDWAQALNTGQYQTHPVAIILETAALVVYTGLALRFLMGKLNWK